MTETPIDPAEPLLPCVTLVEKEREPIVVVIVFVVTLVYTTALVLSVRLPLVTLLTFVILVVPLGTSSFVSSPSTLVAELLEQSYSS